MILYHGTNCDFSEIDLKQTKPYKDFGKGFYLTDISSQAYDLAEKRSLFLGGSPIVLEYFFDESILTSQEIKCLKFEKPTKEWAEFIFKNRSKNQNFTHTFDIVYGPIADDGVAFQLDRYTRHMITLATLVEELTYRKLNRQYYFGTERALQTLIRQ